MTSPSTRRARATRRASAHPSGNVLKSLAAGPLSVVTWEPVDLSQALVVVGFPSVGLVGSIATSFLVDSFKLREVGALISPTFPPTAVVHDGIGASPVRIFIGDVVCGPDGTCEQLCVIVSNMTPKPAMIAPLAHALVTWAQEHGGRELVCLEGLSLEGGPGEVGRIFGLASDANGRRMLESLKVAPHGEGVLVGLGGVLMYTAAAYGQPALCFLAETREGFPDARSAAKLLEALQPLVPLLKIDERPLLEQAQVLETMFRQQVERSKRAEKELAPATDVMFG